MLWPLISLGTRQGRGLEGTVRDRAWKACGFPVPRPYGEQVLLKTRRFSPGCPWASSQEHQNTQVSGPHPEGSDKFGLGLGIGFEKLLR